MERKVLAIGALFVLLIAGFVSAHGFFVKGESVGDDTREQLEQAIEDNDYEAFVQVHEELGIETRVSEEVFSGLVERRGYAVKVRAAIEAGDYEEWKSLLEDSGDPHSEYLLSVINAGNFSKLQELEQLRQKEKALAGELGLTGSMGGFGLRMGLMGHRMMHDGFAPGFGHGFAFEGKEVGS